MTSPDEKAKPSEGPRGSSERPVDGADDPVVTPEPDADSLPDSEKQAEAAEESEAEESEPEESEPKAVSTPAAGDEVPVKTPEARRSFWRELIGDVPEPDVLASSARSIALSALIGFAIVGLAQFTFMSEWVSAFVRSNKLEMSRRMLLLYSMLGGAGLGVAGCVFWLNWAEKHERDPKQIEGWLWLASPLILLPSIPLLFRYKAWRGRHEDLLVAVFFTGLVIEVLIARALLLGPETARTKLMAPLKAIPALVKKHGPTLAVVLGVVIYVSFFGYYTVLWHHQLGTGNYDLSINNNLVYNGLNGVFNQSAVVFPDNPGKYLANHVKIGVYTLLPIYALYPRPEMLLVIQSVLMGLGALPLYGFARKRVSDATAAIIALCYLAYYPMHGANFYEVKMVPMASFFVLSTVWAADSKRWVLMGLAFAQALLFREDMPIGLAVIAAVLLLSGHRPVAGAIMLLISCCWFVFIRFYLMEEVGKWWFPKMYKDLWSPGEQGFKSVIKTLLTNPYFSLQHIITKKKLVYLSHLLVPVMFLPARRWYLWAAFVPGIILTLLVTDYDPVVTYSFQYVMNWAPYLFLAVPLAIVALAERGRNGPARAKAAMVSFAFASVVLSYNYGAFARRPIKGGYHTIGFHMSKHEAERYAQLQELVSMVPPDASVAATEKVGPHLSSRRYFYSLRKGTWGAEYLVARSKELKLQRTRPTLFKALDSGKYGVVRRLGNFALMKKGYSTKDNQDLIRDWRLDSDSKSRKDKDKDKDSERDKDKEKPDHEVRPEPDQALPAEEAAQGKSAPTKLDGDSDKAVKEPMLPGAAPPEEGPSVQETNEQETNGQE